MSDTWDDFDESLKPEIGLSGKRKLCGPQIPATEEERPGEAQNANDCNWGFDYNEANCDDDHGATETISSEKFIPVYERFMNDKQSIVMKTQNYKLFVNNAQKELRDWFENEGEEFKPVTSQLADKQYVCELNLPVGEHEFAIKSEVTSKRSGALEEVCLAACRMLDECQLLYSWQSATDVATDQDDHDRREQVNEASGGDDIEFDRTHNKRQCCGDSARTTMPPTSSRASSETNRVNTYESLMAQWSQLNMSILKAKAELVRLDPLVAKQRAEAGAAKRHSGSEQVDVSEPLASGDDTGDDGDEIDPLDAYMSTLESKTSKTKLSMDEKIEMSRLKAQIATHEREQAALSRLIELAKPTFNLDKVGRAPAKSAPPARPARGPQSVASPNGRPTNKR